MKKFLILVIIAGSIAVSYFYSEDVYRFYLKSYYKDWKKVSEDDHLRKSEDLFRKKEYEDLEDYLKKLSVLYPENTDFIELSGRNFIKMGKEEKGIEMLLSIKDKVPINDSFLEITVQTLYNGGMYRDVIDIMENRVTDNPNILYCYGISLFTWKKYREARHVLNMAVNEGRNDATANYHLGLCHDMMGDLNRAIDHVKIALNMRPRNRTMKSALIELYRKAGKYNEAAKLMEGYGY